MNDLVDVQKRDEIALEDMQAPLDALETMGKTPPHRIATEAQPLAQNAVEAAHAGSAVDTDHVEVDAIAALEIRRCEEMTHQSVAIDAIRARHDYQARRILVIRFIAQIGDHRQLLGLHLLGDLFQDLRARGLERQSRHHDVTLLELPNGPEPQTSSPRGVELSDLRGGGNDFSIRREIRPFDNLAELRERGLGRFEQTDGRRHDLAKVVRGDVRGHADRDPRRSIEENVRYLGGQERGLIKRAVEVWHPIHRTLAKLPEEYIGIGRETRLRVAHRRKGLGIVRRAPVALTIDQGIAVAEVLSHEHHRFIGSAVAMGMKLADDIADGTRGLLELGASF